MKKAEKYIFAAVCCTGVLPYILKSVLVLCKKTALLQWQDVLCDFATMALAIAFLGLALGAYCGEGKWFPSKKRIRELLYRAAILVCIAYATKVISTLLFAMGTASIATHAWIAIIVALILGLLILWVVIWHTMKFVATLFAEASEWRVFLKEWKIWLATLGMLVVITCGQDILELLIAYSPLTVRGSFLTRSGFKIIWALLLSEVLHAYLCLCMTCLIKNDVSVIEDNEVIEEKETQEEFAEIEASAPEELIREPIRKREIVVAIMFVACIVIQAISVLNADEKASGLYKMAAILEEGKMAADLGKEEVAMQCYLTAERYMQGLDAWLNQDNDTLSELMWNNRLDEFFQQLYYVSTKDYSYIENEVSMGEGTEARYHLVLKEYATLEELSEEQVALQRECLDVCISKEYFRENLKWYRTEDWKRNAVKEEINAYQDKIFYNRILENMIATQKQGGLSKVTVEEMLALAEEYPENLYCQMLAMQYGVKYCSVDESYREQLYAVALRYHALYAKTTDDAIALANTKSYVAQILMSCGYYEEAIEFLAEAKELDANINIATYMLNCYYAQEIWEQVQTIAGEYLQENPKDGTAIYYSAMAYLKQDEVNAALERIKALEMLVMAEEEKEKYAQRLSNFAKQIFVAENAESYMAMLDKETTPLLYWNVMALDSVYRLENLEEAQLCLKEIERFCPGLSTTIYLQGEIAYQQGDYEAAKDFYENYMDIDGENLSVLYRLASIYEEQGEYDAAWRKCNRIMFLSSADVVAADNTELIQKTETLLQQIEEEAHK